MTWFSEPERVASSFLRMHLEVCLQSLLEELCRVAAEPVYLLFEEERAKGQPFEEFIRLSLRSDGERIFDPFPALSRWLAVVFWNWIRTTRLFMRRLAADAPA